MSPLFFKTRQLFQLSLYPESVSQTSNRSEHFSGSGDDVAGKDDADDIISGKDDSNSVISGVMSSGNFSLSTLAMCSATMFCQMSATYCRRLKRQNNFLNYMCRGVFSCLFRSLWPFRGYFRVLLGKRKEHIHIQLMANTLLDSHIIVEKLTNWRLILYYFMVDVIILVNIVDFSKEQPDGQKVSRFNVIIYLSLSFSDFVLPKVIIMLRLLYILAKCKDT